MAETPAISALGSPPSSVPNGGKQLRDAAVEFESLLLNIMMKSMRSSVPKSGLFGDESKTRMYEEMRDTELSKVMARQGGLGLAESIVKQYAGREGEGLDALRSAGQNARKADDAYRAQSHLAESGISPLSTVDFSHPEDQDR